MLFKYKEIHNKKIEENNRDSLNNNFSGVGLDDKNNGLIDFNCDSYKIIVIKIKIYYIIK